MIFQYFFWLPKFMFTSSLNMEEIRSIYELVFNIVKSPLDKERFMTLFFILLSFMMVSLITLKTKIQVIFYSLNGCGTTRKTNQKL